MGVGLLLGLPSGAAGATQIGATFDPTSSDPGGARYQAVSPGDSYLAPSAGVITSWSFFADSSPPVMVKLKVGRHAGGGDVTTVGEGGPHPPVPGLNTFATRIPVQEEDVLGISLLGGGQEFLRGAPSYMIAAGPDVPPGSTATFALAGAAQLDVSALLEPDGDNDGFGDETQDGCVGQEGPNDGCPFIVITDGAPETTITHGPKAKTKKRTATFEFTASIRRIRVRMQSRRGAVRPMYVAARGQGPKG